MPEGEETFFRHLTNLRSLELGVCAILQCTSSHGPA